MKTMSIEQRRIFEDLVRDVGIAPLVLAVRDRVDLKASGEDIPHHHPSREGLISGWREYRRALDSAAEAAHELEQTEKKL